MKKYNRIIWICTLTIGLLTACNLQNIGNETTSSQLETTTLGGIETTVGESENNSIMDEFDLLTGVEEVDLKEVITFMKENISKVNKKSASKMVSDFEQVQSDYLQTWSEQFYREEIQQAFLVASEGFTVDLNNPDNLAEENIKNLILSSKELGYKLEMAEGSFFPVVEYSFYEQFLPYVMEDMNGYILLMVAESNEPPMKDAGIVISYEEIIKRVLLQESFLNEYPDSELLEKVQELYNKYEYITFFGAPNTPLFDYNTKVISEKAKAAYEAALETESDSEFLVKLSEFMNILNENNFKLEDEADAYRNEHINNSASNKAKANPYYIAGFDDPKEFEDFFKKLQRLIKEDDRASVARYVSYPLKYSSNGTEYSVVNKEEFIEKYDTIITEQVKTVFSNQDIKQLFVNAYGVSVGNGEVWISMIDGTEEKYSIYRVNQ